MSFENLKKSRSSFLDNLRDEAEKLNKNSYSDDDDRFWKPTTDKAGNGSAIIRFLPPPDGEDVPWVRRWSHGFKGPTGFWYIENCPTTLNNKCPVCENNSELWNTEEPKKKAVASRRKRKQSFYANILVLKDPGNPENEGKIFLYRFGVKIMDKIKDKMNPEDALGDDPINPFDFWDGANFRLKIHQQKGDNNESYPNYDNSSFDAPTELYDGDEAKLKEVYETLHSLAELVETSEFEEYDTLKEKFNRVVGSSTPSAPQVDTPEPKSEEAPSLPETVEDDITYETEDEDDGLENIDSFFEQLEKDED